MRRLLTFVMMNLGILAVGIISACGGGGSSAPVVVADPDLSLSVSTTNIFEMRSRHTQLGSDINGETASDQFGSAVALSADGTTLVVGAPQFAIGSGLAQVMSFNGTAWTQLGDDLAAEAAGDNFGNAVAISDDGETIVIGAKYNDGTANLAGQARVYTLTGQAWVQSGNDIDGEATGDLFGHAVAISGDGTTVAVGAIKNDGLPNDSGHVRVFRFSDDDWGQIGADINGELAGDESGASLSLSTDGTILAIGATLNDGTGTSAGHVRVYQFASNSWSQLGSDIDGEAAGDLFGSSVALSGDGTVLAVGAPRNDGSGTDSGHVRVYSRSGTAWTQLGSDIDGEEAGDLSGTRVALSDDGTTVVISAPNNEGSALHSGHVRVYTLVDGDWVLFGPDINGEAENDFSSNVALSADGLIVAVGANLNDGGGIEAGHVRVFSRTLVPHQATVTATLSAATSSNVLVMLTATGTASGESVDYLLSTSNIIVSANQTTGTTTVTAIPDSTTDADETIILTITDATGATVTTDNVQTITIGDL